ncbi:hypothetical protein [Mucilaginibacter sp. UYCu711]|uniref:hypothetical protein n=1 Tax=Mucilaginibacter sp. UYCu711 TaxID=3156339 RepID=UPI003D23D7C1
MNQLILWNNHEYTKTLTSWFAHSVIVNSYDDLLLNLSITDFSYIVILCELSCQENGATVKLQALYGIELAKKLRRADINLPIIFASVFSRKQAYANKLDRGIINSIGHGFIQLPFSKEQLLEVFSMVKPLNDLELYDVVHNYCSLPGMVKMLLHSLNGLQSSGLESGEEKDIIKGKINNAIIQIYSLFSQKSGQVLHEFNIRFPNLTRENLNDAIRFVENIGTELMETYAPSERSGSLVKAKGNWALLLLDDEITNSHTIVKKLKERDVRVFCAQTAEEAQSFLISKNKIVLVLSDYRLEVEVDGLKIHQLVQGYQFLKELSIDRPSYLRLAALSSLPRKFLMQSFRHYGIRVEVFSKKDYLENFSTIEILCDDLVDMGNENMEAIVRLPRITSDTWEFFEPYYRHHRNSFNYQTGEDYVNLRSKLYCEGIVKNEYPFNLKGYTALNFDAKKAKVQHSQDSMDDDPLISEKYYKIFLEKCICRRVAIWYSQYNQDWQLKDVLKIIKGNEYTGDEKETTAKNQINYNLALSLAEYPWNMTVEEKQWLIYQMNIRDIEVTEEQESALLGLISDSLETWLNIQEVLDELLKNEDFDIFFTGGQGRYSANFRILKSFLHQLYLFLVGKDELIKSLQKQIIALQRAIPDTKHSVNTSRFISYLEFFRTQLMFTKSIKKDAKITIGNMDVFFKEIVQKVIQRIPEYQQKEFPGTAAIFYAERSSQHLYTSKNEWAEALLKFHGDMMGKWSSYGVLEYDESKGSKKQAGVYKDDY